MFDKIPNELKEARNWVCWKKVNRDGKITKIPINPATGAYAKSNAPSTWTDFGTALKAYKAYRYKYSGLGFMFSNSPYFGIDIDKIGNDVEAYKSGQKQCIIGEFISALQTYAEYSQSGTGIHLICKGELPEGGRRKNNVEMYDNLRFFVITGDQIPDSPNVIADCTESVKPLYSKYIGELRKNTAAPVAIPHTDQSIQEIIDEKCKNDEVFKKLLAGDYEGLYDSHSEADMAFCCKLVLAGCDESQIDLIVRDSGLFRDKWDSRRADKTYGQLVIQNAINFILG